MSFRAPNSLINFTFMATAYLMVLLPPFLMEWIHDYSGVYYLYKDRGSYVIDTSLLIILVAFILTCITQYTGRLQRGFFIVCLSFWSILGVLSTGHVILYDAPISVGAIDALLGTDVHEALEYLTFQWSYRLALNVFGYAAVLLVGFISIKKRIDVNCSIVFSQLLAWPIIILLALSCYQYPLIAQQNKPEFKQWAKIDQMMVLNNQVPSVRIIYNIHEWLDYREWLKESQDLRSNYRFNAVSASDRPQTLIVVLGESLRRSNLSLYGYDKKTTPNLDARSHQMLVFKKAIAPANQTVPSITKMLTTATVAEPDKFLFQPSIITAAKEAGVRTYWLSNQGRVGQFDSKISLLAHEADTQIFTNTEFYGSIFDERLLHPLSIALNEAYRKKLIVVHLQGSHQSYKNRYPAEAKVFKPDQYKAGSQYKKQNKVMSQYDNSIHYTDKIMELIFQQLEKIPGSVLLFVSDHGERFYENGVATAGHGYAKPTRNEYDVPYFIWCNGSCADAWQQATIRNRLVPFSTENLFHTIANLSGLKFGDYQPEEDILSVDYKVVPVKVVSTDRTPIYYKDLP